MTLTFSGEHAGLRFAYAYTGLCLGGSRLAMTRGRKDGDLRTENRLLAALDAISRPTGVMLPSGDEERTLLGGDQAIDVTAVELARLVACVTAAPWKTGRGTRAAEDLLDWLAAAQAATAGGV